MSDNTSTSSMSLPSQEDVPNPIRGKVHQPNGSNTIPLVSPCNAGKRANVHCSHLNNRQNCHFSSLQHELHIEIFKHLPTTDAVCLALNTTNSWEIFNGAFSRLFPIRFRAVNEGILQRPAFKNLPGRIGLKTRLRFRLTSLRHPKEPHDKFVQLQKSWEVNQQFCRELQETMEWVRKQVSKGFSGARTCCNLVSKGALCVYGHESRKRYILFSYRHLLNPGSGFSIIPLYNYKEGSWVSHNVANY